MEKIYTEFKFQKLEEAKTNKLFINILFEGGDADTRHPEQYDLEINYSDYMKHLDKINKEIALYKTLQNILDVNSYEYLEDSDEVLKLHGEDIADLYDYVPGDPQCDFQRKCYISSIELIGYDEFGTSFKAYIN